MRRLVHACTRVLPQTNAHAGAHTETRIHMRVRACAYERACVRVPPRVRVHACECVRVRAFVVNDRSFTSVALVMYRGSLSSLWGFGVLNGSAGVNGAL